MSAVLATGWWPGDGDGLVAEGGSPSDQRRNCDSANQVRTRQTVSI